MVVEFSLHHFWGILIKILRQTFNFEHPSLPTTLEKKPKKKGNNKNFSIYFELGLFIVITKEILKSGLPFFCNQALF